MHYGRPLRDQPRDESAYPAASDDFLDVTEEAHLIRH
jgi:hypothetical protein